MFISPRNPATKTLAGCLNTSIGRPCCWTTPSRMMATRVPIVIASL